LAAGETPRARIVGFSLDGMIALALALDHASRVDRLVLLSAVAGRTEPERARASVTGWRSCASRASRR
jgi:(E)-2-((N-methylformamido)methylene)succinate hydrolase